MEFQEIEEKKAIKVLKEKNIEKSTEINEFQNELNQFSSEISALNEDNKNVFDFSSNFS